MNDNEVMLLASAFVLFSLWFQGKILHSSSAKRRQRFSGSGSVGPENRPSFAPNFTGGPGPGDDPPPPPGPRRTMRDQLPGETDQEYDRFKTAIRNIRARRRGPEMFFGVPVAAQTRPVVFIDPPESRRASPRSPIQRTTLPLVAVPREEIVQPAIEVDEAVVQAEEVLALDKTDADIQFFDANRQFHIDDPVYRARMESRGIPLAEQRYIARMQATYGPTVDINKLPGGLHVVYGLEATTQGGLYNREDYSGTYYLPDD